jgi:hypothetical protein
MTNKRYCPRNHDTHIVGRKKSNRRCKMCEYEDNLEFHEKRINDPIRRMLKNAKERIRKNETKLRKTL